MTIPLRIVVPDPLCKRGEFMQTRKLGNTDIDVSLICLGTMTWGEQNTEQEAFEQLDYATGAGINFIDAAEMYPVPPRAETQGLTETYLGNWLARRGKRDDLVIASKVAGPGNGLGYLRGGPRLTREHIREACETSLKRLQTDYLDLYQVHWPDRPHHLPPAVHPAAEGRRASRRPHKSSRNPHELSCAGPYRQAHVNNLYVYTALYLTVTCRECQETQKTTLQVTARLHDQPYPGKRTHRNRSSSLPAPCRASARAHRRTEHRPDEPVRLLPQLPLEMVPGRGRRARVRNHRPGGP